MRDITIFMAWFFEFTKIKVRALETNNIDSVAAHSTIEEVYSHGHCGRLTIFY